MCPGLAVNRSHLLLGILIKQKTKRTHQAGPRNIYTVRPEFREKGAAVVAEAEQPAKRVCVADSDTAIAVAKTKTKPVGVSLSQLYMCVGDSVHSLHWLVWLNPS